MKTQVGLALQFKLTLQLIPREDAPQIRLTCDGCPWVARSLARPGTEGDPSGLQEGFYTTNPPTHRWPVPCGEQDWCPEPCGGAPAPPGRTHGRLPIALLAKTKLISALPLSPGFALLSSRRFLLMSINFPSSRRREST